jgi:hypothetical protein
LLEIFRREFKTVSGRLRVDELLAKYRNTITVMDMALQSRAHEVEMRNLHRKAIEDIFLMLNPSEFEGQRRAYSCQAVVAQVADLIERCHLKEKEVDLLRTRHTEVCMHNSGARQLIQLRAFVHNTLDSDRGGKLWQEIEHMSFAELIGKLASEDTKQDAYIGSLESQVGEARMNARNIEEVNRELQEKLDTQRQSIERNCKDWREVDRLNAIKIREQKDEIAKLHQLRTKLVQEIREYLVTTHALEPGSEEYSFIHGNDLSTILNWSVSHTHLVSDAVRDIIKERDRVRDEYLQADDKEPFDLAKAAAVYAVGHAIHNNGARVFPWSNKYLPEVKHKSDRRRQLVIAGQLIVAEIERLDRLAASVAKPTNMEGAFEEGPPARLWAKHVSDPNTCNAVWFYRSLKAPIWHCAGDSAFAYDSKSLIVCPTHSHPAALEQWMKEVGTYTEKRGYLYAGIAVD